MKWQRNIKNFVTNGLGEAVFRTSDKVKWDIIFCIITKLNIDVDRVDHVKDINNIVNRYLN